MHTSISTKAYLVGMLSFFSTTICLGQITTLKVKSQDNSLNEVIYDSTLNFVGKNPYQYVGQEFFVKPNSERLRKYGYRDFLLDYTKDSHSKSNIYKCCDGYNSKYDELAGKYFKVIEVLPHPEAKSQSYYEDVFFLKLEGKQDKDIVYAKYDTKFEHTFPFIGVGFFEKAKKKVLGNKYVFCNECIKSSKDIKTGSPIVTRTGEKWKCVDFTIEEEYYNLSLVCENSKGQQITYSYSSAFGPYSSGRFYSEADADMYKKKFGEDKWVAVLEGKTQIGMTKEMCKLSWGEPEKVNETINSAGKSEQWVYKDNYLYFRNGLLYAMQ